MSKIGNYKEAILAEYERLEEHAKDCGVFYGIYSPQYAEAIHKMNEHFLANQPVKLTFKEKVIIERNKILNKWKLKNS